MYSGGPLSDSDDIFNYNTHGYVVPTVSWGQYEFEAIGDMMQEVEAINDELDLLAQKHSEEGTVLNSTQRDEIKEQLNSLTQQRAELDRRISCIDQRVTLDDLLGTLT